ncbi:MAG: hypothetical protein RL331_1377 [Bacteroidota bacterium]|jgi:phosphatidylserine/phosphatidylglycerophosphate/cardiolipin synthase-like enzyme
MSRFLDHESLAKEIICLFEEAENEITIVSPYIKLHPDIKKVLRTKMVNSNFTINVLFGKNEGDLSKSLSVKDFEFFKEFENVYIHYQENLHAKYYANDFKSIITSINLHEYSINNNIEIGILLERKTISLIGDNSMDTEVFEYFNNIFEKSIPVYNKKIETKRSLLGLVEKKVKSNVIVDDLQLHYHTKTKKSISTQRPGFCIRTGMKIPFNLKMPFSQNSFKSWSQYKKDDYPEKYCHFTGEKSDGKTSFAKPILIKNWQQAKETFGINY